MSNQKTPAPVLLSALRAALYTHGHITSVNAKALTGYDSNTYCREYGSWVDACLAAGYCVLKSKLRPAVLPHPCANCGVDVAVPSWRFSKFCSVKCSNANRGVGKYTPPTRNRDQWLADVRHARHLRITESNFDDLSVEDQRTRVFHDQKQCCNRCTLGTWLGEKIALELEHKNGDNQDNRRENLEALCPNCHSLTPTWRGRNSKGRSKKIDIGNIRFALASGLSLRAALISQGFAGKGATFARVKKLLADLTTE